MRAAALVVLFCVLGAAQVSSAHAQREPTDAELAEARALYMAGQAAVDSGRWADAVGSFRRSYELSHVAAALFNMAFSLRALGRHTDSRDAFDLLVREHPDLDRALMQDARRYRDEMASRVATLVVDGLDAASRYTLGFDGQRVVDDGARPFEIDADGGSHSLTVRLEGFQPWLWEGMLDEGERLQIEASLRAIEVAPAFPPPGGRTEPVDEGGGIATSPVFWTILGLVVVGAGVAVGWVLLRDRDELSPNADRVFRL